MSEAKKKPVATKFKAGSAKQVTYTYKNGKTIEVSEDIACILEKLKK